MGSSNSRRLFLHERPGEQPPQPSPITNEGNKHVPNISCILQRVGHFEITLNTLKTSLQAISCCTGSVLETFIIVSEFNARNTAERIRPTKVAAIKG
jgi:hypothetical protein